MACFKMKLRYLCFAVVFSSIAVSCCRGQGGGGAAGGAGGAVVPGTQDAIQIVAQAALCFDNRQVINGCLQSMGINMNGNGSSNGSGNGNGNGNGGVTSPAGAPALAPAPGPSAAGSGTNNGSAANILCQGPCFGQMMLIMTCVNGILGNIQGYSPGLMQGVQSIFQMACGNVSNGQGGGGAGGGGGGAGGGGAGGGVAGGGGGGAGGGGGGGAGGGGGTGSAAVAAGSHVAVSNLGDQTSAAGPMASLWSGFPSTLITWNCIWLLPLLYVAL